jgi:hypothetical protein
MLSQLHPPPVLTNTPLQIHFHVNFPSTTKPPQWYFPLRFCQPGYLSQYNDRDTGRTTKGSIPGRGRDFFSSPPLPERLWGPINLLYNGNRCLPGVKPQSLEADRSSPSSAGVKNTWSYTSTPPFLHGKVLN